MREVFQKVGVQIPDQVFQDLWQEAERRDPHGEVRVHTPLVSIEYVCISIIVLYIEQHSVDYTECAD